MLQPHHYVGEVALGSTINITFFATNASGTPATPSVGPTWLIHNEGGDIIDSGTATNFASVTGLYRIAVTPTLATQFQKGQKYSVVVNYTATIQKGEVFDFLVV